MQDLRRKCFFCSLEIEEKKTLEHIIPNSLLGKLGMKEQTIKGQKETQYSRIKVPAHSRCNNEFGSEYENKILKLLDDPDSLYESIIQEESKTAMIYSPDDSSISIITTWLSKIYYGLFYYDMISTQDESWREVCTSIVSDSNFNFVQKSYKNGHGFQLPSSLYAFKTMSQETDLTTIVYPSCILLKIKSLTLILCICDGFLTRNYLHGEALDYLRKRIESEEKATLDFPAHKLALAEILALRNCIPKTPKFISSDNQIINMSLTTLANNPSEYYKINNEKLNQERVNALRELGFVIV
ncbi:hypothetical protein [uncultured Deefgea sp.]|uniref:hypothetical protein n=1 Tax=uncultured Deefgea sp. TaxID=1304914 RepID=UPI002592B97D|nr:hypothetical protein [uncultured Deefgea sp.]